MRRLFVSLIFILSGCSDGFAPYSKLESLRILGVASDPAMPRAGIPATIRALTYAPAPQATTYQWSLCPVAAKASDNYACPVTWETASAVLGPGVPPTDLGASAEATFTHALAPATLATICASGFIAPTYAGEVDCDLGYPMTVVLDATSDGKNLRAAFVVYLPITEDPATDNQNPSPMDLLMDSLPIADRAAVATPKSEVAVRTVMGEDAAELRPIPAFEGGTGTRRERLTFSWFTTAGAWDNDRTAFIDGDTPFSDASSNTWTAPDVLPDALTFAVVVRDDRGGVGWVQRTAQMGGQP